MGSGSDTGRRLLAIGAVCCAIVGLLLAASAMPMVASESPASGFFDADEQDLDQSSARGAQQAPDVGTDDGDGSEATGDDAEAAGDGSGGGTAAATGAGSPLATSLADRADDLDSPILEGALYGLASLASMLGDGSSADLAGTDAGAEDAAAEAATGPEADFAASGVGGEFGDALAADDADGEFSDADEDGGGETDAEADGEETGADDGADGEFTNADDGTTAGDSGSEASDGSLDGDDSGSGETDSSDGGSDDDGSPHGGGDDGSEGGEFDSNGDPADTGESSAGSDDAGETDDAGDEASAADEDGVDESGLEDSVPGLSDGVVTAALVAIVLLVVGYVIFTREDPIGTLLSIPGRVVSLALAGVVACSQALERAVSALRGLRSIADLPGLVLATIRGAFQSVETRVRNARSSFPLFGRGDAEEIDADEEITVTARERIRQAFASVIDASPTYRGRVATATPAEVARSARDAGAPAEPVETITDSFRDVEYGERDPASYLERTTTAHERLRAELEATEETNELVDEVADELATDPAEGADE